TTTIRGLGIRFPELKIGLPSIELPGLVRRTRSAEMELDRGVAPFSASPPATVARGINSGMQSFGYYQNNASNNGTNSGQPQEDTNAGGLESGTQKTNADQRCEQLENQLAATHKKMAVVQNQITMMNDSLGRVAYLLEQQAVNQQNAALPPPICPAPTTAPPSPIDCPPAQHFPAPVHRTFPSTVPNSHAPGDYYEQPATNAPAYVPGNGGQNQPLPAARSHRRDSQLQQPGQAEVIGAPQPRVNQTTPSPGSAASVLTAPRPAPSTSNPSPGTNSPIPLPQGTQTPSVPMPSVPDTATSESDQTNSNDARNSRSPVGWAQQQMRGSVAIRTGKASVGPQRRIAPTPDPAPAVQASYQQSIPSRAS
ncbi:MAG: hypothetical protein AAFN70_19660, partial [Planctomycetota bacterium]